VPKNFTLDKLKRAFDKEGLTLTDRETYNTFMAGLHRFMAETRSRMVAFQLEDVLGIVPQVNLPGTRERDEIGYQRDPDLQFYKNWRQKLPAFEVMNPELRAGSDAGKPTDESKAFELAFKAIAEGRAYAQQQAARQAQRANPFA
jgi:hypothetical protein